MFSPDFQKVYEEAFLSATARPFTDQGVQQEYTEEVSKTTKALLTRWTDPTFDPTPITDLSESRRAQAFRIKHPSTAEFTEEDAHDIAQVRFLGSTIIKVAQKSLHDNPYISDDPDRFEGRQWARVHPDEDELREDLGYNTEAPSPQRLREWPYGNYINCLGIAIAAAAESENSAAENGESNYVFINQIRDAGRETAKDALQFFERLSRLSKDAFSFEYIMHIYDGIREYRYTSSEYARKQAERCIRDQEHYEYLHYYATHLDSSFHHSVLRRKNKKRFWGGEWEQFDPYGLAYSDLAPILLERALSSNQEADIEGDYNELLFLDGDIQQFMSVSMANSLEIAQRSNERLEKIFPLYKSVNYRNFLKEEFNQIGSTMFMTRLMGEKLLKDVSTQDLFEKRYFTEDDDLLWNLLMTAVLEENPSLKKSVWEEVEKIEGKKSFSLKLHFSFDDPDDKGVSKVMEKTIFDRIRYDTSTRRSLEKVMRAMPFVIALHTSEKLIEMNFYLDRTDKAMEVGDPAFQIGSMYLNHYARWREDGIINVAKELARINPSQLIWQSAVSQERGVVTDERISAVGAVIKSLKLGQQHPLVRITQPTKEREDGKQKMVGRESSC